jgi:hypothetical protein
MSVPSLNSNISSSSDKYVQFTMEYWDEREKGFEESIKSTKKLDKAYSKKTGKNIQVKQVTK